MSQYSERNAKTEVEESKTAEETATARATVFSLTAKISKALAQSKRNKSKKSRLSAMHGVDSDDSGVNMSDYSSEDSDSDSDTD